ncbi:C1 family peptidase [Bacteroidia bacterium]|nr:C1 family peptidase [Bacteroidia bacterium]MDB4107077.1 C1 family peptidase [Bacteroidia bacterium]MDB9882619.1 C1 family peptidase [Bacteroidia bacterium]MDC1395113.1 C1 family peptidase [Bacteroidia bacterium]
MNKFSFISAILVSSLFLFQYQLKAQDTLRNKKDGNYIFTIKKDIEANEVQNQNRTGTCWSFSALSFMESELMRMGKGTHKLSEMYIVRKAYEDKAENYVRMHGTANFSQGGAFHDIPHVIKKYGIVPQEAYKGLDYGLDKHNHSEMEAALKGILDAVIANKQGHLTTSWEKAFNAVLDAYLGAVPTNFTYKGASYTPMSFAKSLDMNMDDYVIITSFTHHPFYTNFVLEVPDNWIWASAYNLPMDEMMSLMRSSVMSGYSIGWAADVSEKGFSFKNGLAIVPKNDEDLKVKGKDNKHFNDAGADKSGSQFDSPGKELEITQELRQLGFDNYLTTDDHGMHFTGIVSDQLGNEYFIVKNSWGTDHNDCDGYFYASMPYVAYKTMNFMVHKDALPKSLKKTMGN